MGCDNNEDNFVLTIMLALGVCLCVIAFFCGGEMMIKAPTWIRRLCNLAIGIATIILLIVIFICIFVNRHGVIKAEENQYYVLTNANVNDRGTLENQRNILVYDDITCIFPHQFSGYYNLEKIEFYGKVRIHEAAFFGCTNLNEVVFHNGIISIGTNAFAGCKNLCEINYTGTKEEWEKSFDENTANWKKDITSKCFIHIDGKKYKLENDGKLSEVIAESCN